VRLSLLLYASLFAAAVGTASLVRPLALAGIRSRRAGMVVCAASLAAAALTLAWPASTERASRRATRLDEIVPEWQFRERHEIHVDASPERVDAAIRGVTAREIRLFRTLTAIRRLGRSGRESILNAPADEPILSVATRSGFEWLADEPGREMVVGIRVAQGTLAAMSFLIAPDGHGGVNLSTETRVFADSDRSRRSFAVYWRAILPGSDLIRRSWLRAIRRRAEG
jgi:hypothetical protein